MIDNKMQMPAWSGFRERKRFFFACLALIVLIVVVWKVFAFAGWLPSSNFPAVSGSEWQAVFLTNNQVYFGHLKNLNRGYVILDNIFYLRAAESLQQGANPGGTPLSLVKLGGELHGPTDAMYIPKDKIMFWENLKKDSQVVQAVNTFLLQQKK